MLFAYTSPGNGALQWVAEKTLKPEALDFFDRMNGLFQIPWADMMLTMVQMITLGVCGLVLCQAMGMKEVGKMCVWVTVVDCVGVLLRGVMK
jgi:hypothetical protein